MRLSLGWVVCATLVALGCRSTNSPRPASSPESAATAASELRVLTSGKKISIVAIRREPPVIEIEYVTDLRLSDHTVLQSEVEQIWLDFFREEAEKAGAQRAYILPRERDEARPSPVIERRTASFVYVRDPNGSWAKSRGFPKDASPSITPR